jgi:hypothetical protein
VDLPEGQPLIYSRFLSLTSENLNKTAGSSKRISHEVRLDEVFAHDQGGGKYTAAEGGGIVLVGARIATASFCALPGSATKAKALSSISKKMPA